MDLIQNEMLLLQQSQKGIFVCVNVLFMGFIIIIVIRFMICLNKNTTALRLSKYPKDKETKTKATVCFFLNLQSLWLFTFDDVLYFYTSTQTECY